MEIINNKQYTQSVLLHKQNKEINEPVHEKQITIQDSRSLKQESYTVPALLDTLLKRNEDVFRSLQSYVKVSPERNVTDVVLARHQSDSAMRQFSNVMMEMKVQDTSKEYRPDVHSRIMTNVSSALQAAPVGSVALLQVNKNNLVTTRGFSSDKELSSSLADAIDNIQKDYLNVFQDAVMKFTGFYKDIASLITKLGNFIDASTDGKTVEVDWGGFEADLEVVYSKYFTGLGKGKSPENHLNDFNKIDLKSEAVFINTSTKEEADKWAAQLGGVVRNAGNGTFNVGIDPGPLAKIWKGLLAHSGTQSVGTGRYQAWKAGFDAQDGVIKDDMQKLTQRYSTVNSAVDNLLRALSTAIKELLNTARESWQLIR